MIRVLFIFYFVFIHAWLPAACQEESFKDEDIQNEFLAAANSFRKEEGVKLFSSDKALQDAALLQAGSMASRKVLSHESPDIPGAIDLIGRLKRVKAKFRQAGENVAQDIVENYTPGAPLYVLNDGQSVKYSLTAGGPPLELKSPSQIATSFLKIWKESPPHRANLVEKKFGRFGASCRSYLDERGLHPVYCAQVFAD